MATPKKQPTNQPNVEAEAIVARAAEQQPDFAALSTGQVGQTLLLSFDGPVNDMNVTQFMFHVQSGLNPMVKTLYIRMNTSGGNINAAINLYSRLRDLDVEIITHNVARVDSSGTIIFAAGDKRYAEPHATFLFHPVTFDITLNGTARFTIKQVEEFLSQLKKDDERIKAIILERIKISPRKLTNLYNAGKSFNPEEALKHGVIEEVKAFQPPENLINPLWPPLPIQAQQ